MAQAIRSGRTRLNRSERREQIVAAAAEVFSGRDPATVTFEEIADAAGVSRALVYNYFGDRNGLLEAVYLRAMGELGARVSRALATVGDRREVLRRAVEAHLDYASADPAAYRYASGETPFARLPEFHADRVKATAASLGGGAEGELMATAVLAVIHAAVIHWIEQPNVPGDRMTELLTEFLAGGLAGVHAAGLPYTPTNPRTDARPRGRRRRPDVALA
jgi:AcrR family transcriptional regulator